MTGFKSLFAAAVVIAGCTLMSMTSNVGKDAAIKDLVKLFPTTTAPYNLNPFEHEKLGESISSNEASLISHAIKLHHHTDYYAVQRIEFSDYYYTLVYVGVDRDFETRDYHIANVSKEDGNLLDVQKIAYLDKETNQYWKAEIDENLHIISKVYWYKDEHHSLLNNLGFDLNAEGDWTQNMTDYEEFAKIPEEEMNKIQLIHLDRMTKREPARFSRMQMPSFEEMKHLNAVVQVSNDSIEAVLKGLSKEEVASIEEVPSGDDDEAIFGRIQRSSSNDVYVDGVRIIGDLGVPTPDASAKKQVRTVVRMVKKQLREAKKMERIAKKEIKKERKETARFSRMPYSPTKKEVKIEEPEVEEIATNKIK